MNNGNLPPLESLSINSFASSIIVKSAEKLVSNTKSNPTAFKAALSFLVELAPGSNPNISPIATLTEGAN